MCRARAACLPMTCRVAVVPVTENAVQSIPSIVERANMVIATDYRYMKDSGAPPRFEEAFAFKHILNAVDSDPTFLMNRNPLDRDGERILNNFNLMTNTVQAYAQAVNRFNTAGVSAAAVTILEAADDPPRPKAVTHVGGSRSFTLAVTRGWRFERVDNNFAGPNFLRYEARLRAQYSSPRVAKMSCMGSQGVVNHWDQAENLTWFG
jgi:hypothetical protein